VAARAPAAMICMPAIMARGEDDRDGPHARRRTERGPALDGEPGQMAAGSSQDQHGPRDGLPRGRPLGNLYWDGKPVEVRHFSLSGRQAFWASVIAGFAAAGAFGTFLVNLIRFVTGH
jgi:hypothetical protein